MTTNASKRGKSDDQHVPRAKYGADCERCGIVAVEDTSDDSLEAAIDHSRDTGHRVIAQQDGIHMDIPVQCVTPEVED